MGKDFSPESTSQEVADCQQRCHESPSRPLGPTEDRDSFSVALRLWVLTICDVTSQSLRLGDCVSAVTRLAGIPPLDLLLSLDKLADAHLAVVASGAEPDFIRSVLRTVPSQVRGLVTLLERGIGRISSRDPIAVCSWRQVLTFLLRPDYGFLEEGEFFHEWEERNRRAVLVAPGSIRENFNWVTDRSFQTDTRDAFFPHHGPGSVAFRDKSGRVRTGRLPIVEKDKLIRKCSLLDPRFTAQFPDMAGDDIPSVLSTVPKSWKKRRLIAVESAERMFLQEGLKEGLYYAVRKDTFWSRHIDFSHAEFSHPLVERSSKDGSFATIDLSAASDSVTLGHVGQLFSDMQWILSGLLTARSSRILVEGRPVEIRMFASMGNATTFPVETLVFGTACVEAIRTFGDDPSRSKFRVYGDDIIIESRYAPCLLATLAKYGFKVNENKTFSDPNTRFRESCGVEYFLGSDVTPVRLPRGFRADNFSSARLDAIASWVDLSNDLFRSGLLSCSAEIRRTILTKARRAVPVSSDGSLGFQTFCPNNSHLPSLYSPDFQRKTHIYPAYKVNSCVRDSGDLALYEWLGRAHDRLSDEPIITSKVALGEMSRTINWF